MKQYRNIDTNEIWSEDELRKAYNDFREESEYVSSFESFEDYLDDQLRQGRERIGGLAPVWFAVQETSEDAWDNGSYDLDEAKKMLQEQGNGLIAVIDEDDNFCVEEMQYEDLF